MIEDNSILAINPKSTCRCENDKTFTLYNPDTDMITTISSLGKTLLDMCDGQTSVAEIYCIISDIYNEYSSEMGKSNFLKFLDDLMIRGLVQEKRITDELKVI